MKATHTAAGMKIVKLTAENVKKLTAVEITPDGSLVIVGGKNGAGKTSVLDAIMYALAGGKFIASKPIREGEESGRIVVELDGSKRLVVERRLTASGGSLEIRTAEGFKAPSPQAILDGLCGKIAFDPLDFTRMTPAKQAETLRDLIGLDFTELDKQRSHAYESRTLVNREVKSLKTQVDANPFDPNALGEEVSVTELMADLEKREEINGNNKRERDLAEELADYALRCQDELSAAEDELDRLKTKIATLNQKVKESEVKSNQQAAIVEKLVDADVAEVKEKISSAETVNRKVRDAMKAQELVESLNGKQREADALTRKIAAIDTDKEAQLAAAKWPIDGLGFDDNGVTFNGLPFEQSSGAEQLRASVAIGLALNPTLRVLLIRDGSLLDEENMGVIAMMAKEADAQLWLERVGEDSECSVVIEDGHVKAKDNTNTKGN